MFGWKSVMRHGCAALVALAMFNPALAKPLPGFDCVIEPHMLSDVSSQVDGVVDSIAVERGEQVKKGQVLVQLDSRVERATVAYAQRRAASTAEIRANRASADFSARRQDRVQTLYQDKVLSLDQMDETGTQARLAKLNLMRAEESLSLAKLDLARAQTNLAQRTITSPIDGVVVERYLSPGESVEEKPILRVAQIDPLRVEVIVPVAHLFDITVGQSAIVSPEYPVTDTYQATVTIVDKVADAASGTFRVRLELPNPELKVPAGLRCGIEFQNVEPGAGVLAQNDLIGSP
ncbi:MAG: efflux RND transporter periplasmic adaptor subunit [Gammaproteobacteria bacterium]|nr:efflux RND transporter periplasmic adaptor subunit [Gammaproteobacteria bacterium]